MPRDAVVLVAWVALTCSAQLEYMDSMMIRYNQFLCVIGLTLMVGCTDCSTTATSISDATAPAEPPTSNATSPTVSIPEIPDESCGDGTNGGVWEGDVTTEEELFAAKYCIEINGSVLLENSSNITGIDFPVLERIVGSFSLIDIYRLLSISMPVLATVNEFTITNSDALMNLLLPNLTIVVSEDFAIENSDALMTISMPRLRIVEGDISIKDNGVLTTISLPSLVRSDYMIIENLPSLTELDCSKSRLEQINGDFRLIESDALVDFSMPVLTYVQSNVVFENNDALTSISMPVLTSVDYAFAIQGNPVLTSVSLPLLKEMYGSFILDNNNSLTEIYLPKLIDTDFSLFIENNDALTSISMPVFIATGTDNVDSESIFGYVVIVNNEALTSISLPALTSVNASIYINTNEALTNISMPSLNSVREDIIIEDTDAVINCDLGSYSDDHCP